MVGEIPVDDECSVCGEKVGIIEEEIEKTRSTTNSLQMYLETWKITKYLEYEHNRKKRVIKQRKIN